VCDTFAATMENKNIKLTKSFTVESATRHLGDPLRFRQVRNTLRRQGDQVLNL
jgi:hypothetical protein